MTYDEAMAFWFGRINFEVQAAQPADLKLERMRALLRRVGDPHDRLRIVHLTGTKGKGSTAAMLSSILRAAGYRVGLFTSPHLVHVEERIQIDGRSISREELAARMSDQAPAVREMTDEHPPGPTFFEIGTALGFLHFAYRRVDVALVEVGLGGRFDSTNVVRPLVSVITSIGLDHMAQLGSTEEAIAFQKAGIIKRRTPVVCGPVEPGPLQVIEAVARELHAPMTRVGREVTWTYRDKAVRIQTPRGIYGPSPLKLLGEHQAANAAVAVAVCDELNAAGFAIPPAAIRQGFEQVQWPARIEVISQRPTVILDTAHNVPSIQALIETLRSNVSVAGRKICLFAVSSDKPYEPMLRLLASYFDSFLLTKYGINPRCIAPESLAEVLNRATPHADAAIVVPPADAWKRAKKLAQVDDLIVITGSVFLAGELRPLLVPDRSPDADRLS